MLDPLLVFFDPARDVPSVGVLDPLLEFDLARGVPTLALLLSLLVLDEAALASARDFFFFGVCGGVARGVCGGVDPLPCPKNIAVLGVPGLP